jgi:hypothetical protein
MDEVMRRRQVEKWRDGRNGEMEEMERWKKWRDGRNGEMEKWRDGEMERWRNGEVTSGGKENLS